MEEVPRPGVPPDLGLPISRRRPTALLSTRGAMLTIIKCAIGAGSFSLPRAFMDGGVYISFLTTVFLGLLSAYTLLLLVDSSTISSLLVETNRKRRNSLRSQSGYLSFNYKPLEERSQIVEIRSRPPPSDLYDQPRWGFLPAPRGRGGAKRGRKPVLSGSRRMALQCRAQL